MSDQTIPSVGDVIANRYKLVEELGRGGFGVIYRAAQRKGQTPPELAVKILFTADPNFNQDELQQRFEREALMAKRLQHRHTVRQYQFGTTSSGLHFIAMELLRGSTLSERIETHGPLPQPLILRIARAVLQVLHHGHRQGIVHRDLKPENIMLCNVDGEVDVPKVLDFGAAKTMKGQHDITSAGMTLGSPTYMAPEVLMGKPPEPASDLYSLGLTIAETILGHPLVQGQSAIIRARTQLSPDALPIPDLLQRHPLYRWIATSIDKDLSRRFSSATEMLAALDKFAASELQSQAAATIPRRSSRPSSSPRPPGSRPESTMIMEDKEIHPPVSSTPSVPAPVASDDPTEAMELPPEINKLRARIEANLADDNPDKTAEMTLSFTDSEAVAAVDDFADDPTAFLKNPFHSPSDAPSQSPESPTDKLPAVSGPQPPPHNFGSTPAPPQVVPPPSAPDPTPPPPTAEEKQTGRRAHPFGEQRKAVAGEYGEKKRTDLGEPSFDTDYQTIKTNDGVQDRQAFYIVIGGVVVAVILLLLWFGL